MPACGGDFGLCVLDRAGSPAERDPEPQEAALELETGKLEQLGRLPEIDSLVKVVAEHPGFEKIARVVSASAGGANGKSSQEPIVERIQEDDSFLPSGRNDGKLSLLHPVQDLSGPLGQVGWGDDGSGHRRKYLLRETSMLVIMA
jgi:hypothetical protein